MRIRKAYAFVLIPAGAFGWWARNIRYVQVGFPLWRKSVLWTFGTKPAAVPDAPPAPEGGPRMRMIVARRRRRPSHTYSATAELPGLDATAAVTIISDHASETAARLADLVADTLRKLAAETTDSEPETPSYHRDHVAHGGYEAHDHVIRSDHIGVDKVQTGEAT